MEGKNLVSYGIQSITISNSNGRFHNGTFQMKVDGNNLYIYSTDCKWSEGGTSVWASVEFIFV